MLNRKFLSGFVAIESKCHYSTSFFPSLFILLVILLNQGLLATEVSGDVSDTWTKSNSPYIVTGNIRVPDGDTLSIEPGVRVEFQKGTPNGYEFNVSGTLIAIGAPSDFIIITSNEAIPEKGNWRGIHALPSTNYIDLNYCEIHYAQTAIECDTISQISLSNVEINSCSNAGIYIKECLSDIEIIGCIIQECTSYGILIETSKSTRVTLLNNLIKNIQCDPSIGRMIKAVSINGPVNVVVNDNIISDLNNNIGTGSREAYCYGVEINHSKDVEINHNVLSNLTAIGSTGNYPRNAHCFGISVSSENEVKIMNNQIDSLTSGGGGTELNSKTDAIFIGFHGNIVKIVKNEIRRLKGKYDPIGISLKATSTFGGEIEINENTIYEIESSNPWHQNQYGIGIYFDFWQGNSFFLKVNDNSIYSNEGKGIEFKIYDIRNIQVLEMIGNSIHDCANKGIIFNPNSLQIKPRIMFNQIWNNNVGISLGKCSSELHYNDFFDNFSYDIRNESSENIDAQFNYWGAVTTAEMEAGDNPKNITKIFDHFDDNTKGTVDYDNWLTGEPIVLQADPNNLKNEETSQVTIRGRGFEDNATVKLQREGFQDIIGVVTSCDSCKIEVNFDCTGRQQGEWDVVVINPDIKELLLQNGVNIGEGYSNFWDSLVGRSQIRIGREQRFRILYGNSGNMDVHDVVLMIDIPLGVEYDLNLDHLKINGINWEEISNGFETETRSIIPIWLPIVEANSSYTIDLILKVASGLQAKQSSTLSKSTQIPTSPITITLRHKSNELKARAEAFKEIYEEALWKKLQYEASQEEFDLWLNNIYNTTYQNKFIEYEEQAWKGDIKDISMDIFSTLLSLNPWVTIPLTAIDLAGFGFDIVKAKFEIWYYNLLFQSRFTTVPLVRSMDPNEKAGPTGYGINHSIPLGNPLQYIVYFENLESATAAAEEVLVQDTLDVDLDWSSFTLGEIQFGETTLNPPQGAQSYSTTVILNDTTQVEVTCSFEASTGKLEWYLKGVDPRNDDFMGFLPPNVNSPEGEGHVSFTVKPKSDLASGTEIMNRSSIIFDVNPAMITNEVTNTIDVSPPVSTITDYQSVELPQVNIQWAGEDEPSGSGVKDFSIFVSTDGGPYSAWLQDTSATSAVFSAEEFTRYDLYSQAHDSVGHKEPMPVEPDTIIQPMAFFEFPQQAWYMVSLPVQSIEDSVKYLFPSSLGAFRWNNSTYSYSATEIMSSTNGYWLALPESDSLSVSGALVDTIHHHSQPGWHMVGSLRQSINVSDPNDNPDGSILGFYGWDAQSGTYYQTTTLDPKQAYWMAVMIECDWILGSDELVGKAVKTKVNKSEFYTKYGTEPPSPPNYFFGNEQLGLIPKTYCLYQNYPNPFNPETTIAFDLPENSDVEITIFNILGQKVITLTDKKYLAGSYKIIWDGMNEYHSLVASGIYVYRIRAGEFKAVKKLLLLR